MSTYEITVNYTFDSASKTVVYATNAESINEAEQKISADFTRTHIAGIEFTTSSRFMPEFAAVPSTARQIESGMRIDLTGTDSASPARDSGIDRRIVRSVRQGRKYTYLTLANYSIVRLLLDAPVNTLIETQFCSECTAELPVTEMTHDDENDLYFCAAPDNDRPFCADLPASV